MLYELVVETVPSQKLARFRLCNQDGVQLASHQVQLTDHSPAMWEGLFDTRRYVERYEGSLRLEGQAEPATAEQLLARLGVFLGEEVLGSEILKELVKSRQRRTLLVRLPATEHDVLAAALARVAWEIARPGREEPALMERKGKAKRGTSISK